MNRTSLQQFTLNTIASLLAIYLPIHFFIILIYTGPVNPVSLTLKPYITPYIETFFQQNWHLFAPKPISVNFKMYVRAEYKNHKNGMIEQSAWFDVTSPLIDLNNKTILSPYNRLGRIGTGYVHQLLIGGKDDLSIKILNKKSETKGDLTLLNQEYKAHMDEAKKGLHRLASSYAKKVLKHYDITRVQYMTSIVDSIPYSKRNETSYRPEEKTTIFEWEKVVEDVVAFP